MRPAIHKPGKEKPANETYYDAARGTKALSNQVYWDEPSKEPDNPSSPSPLSLPPRLYCPQRQGYVHSYET